MIRGIKELHARGKRAIIYSNGQLIDTQRTTYWEETRKNVAIVGKDREIIKESWKKFSDFPAGTLSKACMGCEVWQDRLWNLALQANELGADGILYDQLGNQRPYYCYAPNHGHKVPTVVLATEKFKILEDIRNRMYKINPEFIIMTEGGIDPEMNSISFFHSDIFGILYPSIEPYTAAARGKEILSYCYFPEMLKYTFPEFLSTTRFPIPLNHPYQLNLSVLYGFRPEIECRYMPEVKYVLRDEIPDDKEFWNCGHGGLTKHNDVTDRIFARTYMKEVNELCRRHKDLLWSGRFNDNIGINCSSDNNSVIAKSFVRGDSMAVVLWNTDPVNETSYKLEVPGYSLESIEAPEKEVKPGDKLDADRIHICIYKW